MIYNAETEMHSLDTPTFQLRSITLSCCGDGGSFPQSLNHQHDLEYVDLSNINFKGYQFPNWLLENNKKLKELHLANSSLSGHFQLPPTSHRGLLYLDVSNNSLNGNIPNEIGAKVPSLELLNIGGIPRHLPMGLVLFDVSNNQLFGDIPSSMENLTLMLTLDLSNNTLFGGIPRWMGKMSNPMELCNLNSSLQFLDLSANNISGSLPSCFIFSRLTHVYLSRNKLKGPITSFLNSNYLVTLDLSNNHLTGNIPNWIGTLSTLVYLLLDNNHFEGGIPVQLCKLNRLRLIDVSNNNLSGTIPPCLMNSISNDSSHAYYSDYDYNGYIGSFSADVPVEVTMKSISYFYRGRVLTYLSGIDLSCNKLTVGIFLPNLWGYIFLSFFSVAYNNLLGTTPQTTGQFATFEESSYVGNPFLCGEPLPKNCSTDESSSSMPRNATDEGFLDMKVFCASFVGSYIVMPLCIAIVLYINPYWRQAWFYHVEAATMSYYYFVLDNTLPKRFR
ncbi:hypothetical protein V6Z11_A13G235100 [Gossypium hirsutum]